MEYVRGGVCECLSALVLCVCMYVCVCECMCVCGGGVFECVGFVCV